MTPPLVAERGWPSIVILAAWKTSRIASNAGTVLATRNPGNTGNRELINTTGTALTVGDATDQWSQINLTGGTGGSAQVIGYNVYLYSYTAGVAMDTGAGTGLIITATECKSGVPIIGNTAATSPYSCHGAKVSAMTDADYVVPAGEYAYDCILVPNSLSLTTSRKFKLPTPATEAASYTIDVQNNAATTGPLTVYRADGAGNFVTIGNGNRGRVHVRPGGVQLAAALVAAVA